jgi:4-hydroxy-tetrahydrodipicolinate reductase
MIRLAIAGICGRMGTAIAKLAISDPEFQLIDGLERPGHPTVGKRLGDVLAGAPSSCRISDDMAGVIDRADVVVDFTEPASTIEHFKLAAVQRKAIVIGTTGLPQNTLRKIAETHGARVVMSPNMSIGVNLMFDLVQRAASALSDDYDVEILELHHRWKKDAPSGTALKLRQIVEAARPQTPAIAVSGREGIIGERKLGEIAVLAIRGGDIVGEHTVFFAGSGERLEITHRASSRDNFARGALLAAKWLMNQPAGVYDMKNVLGLVR